MTGWAGFVSKHNIVLGQEVVHRVFDELCLIHWWCRKIVFVQKDAVHLLDDVYDFRQPVDAVLFRGSRFPSSSLPARV